MMAPINAQWQQAYYNLGGFNNFHFVDSLHGWFTHLGVDKIVHTSDGGHTFVVQPVTAGNYDKNSIFMENLSTGWCGGGGDGAPGKIHRTTNGGATWVLKSHPAPPSGWNDIAKVGNSIWFVGGYGSQQAIIMKTSNNGTSWQVNLYPEIGTIVDMQMLDEQNVLICGKKAIHRTSDGGNTWVEVAQNPNPDYWFYPMAFVNSMLGYALAYKYGISELYITTDSGFTWNLHYAFTDIGQKSALSVVPSTGTIFVAGSYNNFIDKGIYKSTDGGATWDIFPTNYHINCIYTPTPYQGWAGAGSMIYRYDYVVPPTVEPIPSALIQLGEQFQHQVQATGLGLKYTMSGNPAGLNIGLYSGLIQGTPTQGGNFAITVAVKDTDANVVNTAFNLRINRKPLFIPPFPSTHAWVDSLYQTAISASDIDGDTLTFSHLQIPSFLQLIQNPPSPSAYLQGTPALTDTGYHNISIMVIDGYGGSDTLNFILRVTEYLQLLISPIPDQLIQFGQSFNYQVRASGLGLRYFLAGQPNGLNIGLYSGLISGTPVQGGTFNITVTVQDTVNNTTNTTFALRVNRKPQFIAPFPPVFVWVDSLYYGLLTASDADNDSLIFTALIKPDFLELISNPPSPNYTALLQGTPSITDTGNHSISITASDGYGGEDTLNYILQVIINNPPYFSGSWQDTVFVFKDSSYTWLFDFLDIDEDTLWTITGNIGVPGLNVIEELFGIGSVTSTVTGIPADTGTYTAEVSVIDEHGLTGTLSFTVIVDIVTGINPTIELPTEFILYQNYPNPFNPSTKISWQSPVGSMHVLKVYDVLGNKIATLVEDYKPAGTYEVEFYASGLASGIYFYRLTAGKYSEMKKLILLR